MKRDQDETPDAAVVACAHCSRPFAADIVQGRIPVFCGEPCRTAVLRYVRPRANARRNGI